MVSVSGGICQQRLPGNCGTSFVANIPTSESTVKRLPLQRLAGSSQYKSICSPGLWGHPYLQSLLIWAVEQVTESTQLRAKEGKSPCGSSICCLLPPPQYRCRCFHTGCQCNPPSIFLCVPWKRRLQMLITNIYQLFYFLFSGFTCGEKSTLHLLVLISLCCDLHGGITSEARFLES